VRSSRIPIAHSVIAKPSTEIARPSTAIMRSGKPENEATPLEREGEHLAQGVLRLACDPLAAIAASPPRPSRLHAGDALASERT
jgi:hypothetical protein